LYLAYLEGEGPHISTSDNFLDVGTREFQPYFEEYMGQAFKPLGVNVRFWESKLQAGCKRTFSVVLTNDTEKALTGTLRFSLGPLAGGAAQVQKDAAFDVPALGQKSYDLEVTVPEVEGDYQMKATANCGEPWCPTVSRRRVAVAP
jgi:hypothetical protein